MKKWIYKKMLIIFCMAFMFTIGGCTDDQGFVNKTVCLGEDVTLTCRRQSDLGGILFWIRVVVGKLPEVLGATYSFDHAGVNKTPHFIVKQEPGAFVLYITKTKLSDTAFYYCEQVVELKTIFLNKTFLRVKEPDIPAVIQDFPSLQFSSVLSDSENKTCPGEHSVYWFRAGSDDSYPNVIYTRGNSGDKCENSPEAHATQKCIYNFSKNISSPDNRTYYCAVATCGHIFFGHGSKLDIEADNMVSFGESQRTKTILFLLCAALAISLIVIALLVYTNKKKECNCCNAAVLQTNAATTIGDQQSQWINEDSLIYYVPDFTRRKVGSSVRRGGNAAEGESIYSDVRVLGLE